MRLLAELSAERGRLEAALQWVRRAVAASEAVPTRLREDDEQYLEGLEFGVPVGLREDRNDE